MTICTACEEKLEWKDNVVMVNNQAYHEDCVQLCPSGYIAYIDGEFLGETENDDGQMASDIFPELLDD